MKASANKITRCTGWEASKPSDVNLTNGLDMQAVDSGGSNSGSVDSKANSTTSNSDEGAKLSPVKATKAAVVIKTASSLHRAFQTCRPD